MMLVLTIKSLDQLENGEAARLTLDRHGARIGRSPHMDWCLPDRRSYISSAHCEIEYREGAYWLVDRSTNGTFVNRSPSRLAAPHPIADGDVILIGHYEIEARLDGAVRQDASEAAPPAWGGWDSHAGREPVGVDPSKWDQPAPRAAISGLGSASSAWAAGGTCPIRPSITERIFSSSSTVSRRACQRAAARSSNTFSRRSNSRLSVPELQPSFIRRGRAAETSRKERPPATAPNTAAPC